MVKVEHDANKGLVEKYKVCLHSREQVQQQVQQQAN